jgi:retron-type reverse transcriptase
MRKKVNWIIDLDIRSFFDKIGNDWMVKFVEHPVAAMWMTAISTSAVKRRRNGCAGMDQKHLAAGVECQ